MRRYFVAVVVLAVVMVIVPQVKAFDLVKVDVSQTVAPWWIHVQDYGMPVKQVWQVYGILEYDWFALTTGPVFKVPGTQIDCQMPIGLRLSVADIKLPLTHYVTKINFMGKVGPLKLTAIHDMSWGRQDNSNVFFFQEALNGKHLGIQVEGLKIGKDPLPAYLGPIVLYNFTEQYQVQVFWGVNVRDTGQKCFKMTYSYIKF